MLISLTSLAKRLLAEKLRRGYHWLYFAVFSVLLVALTLLTLQASRESSIAEARYQNSLSASAGTAMVNRLIQNIEVVLPGINDLVVRLPADLPDYDAQVREVLKARQAENPQLMDLLVVNPEGDIVHWSGGGAPPAVRDRDYVSVHLQGGTGQNHFVGKPRLSKVNKGQWFFAVSRAVRNPEGQLQRILVAIVDIAYLHNALLELERPDNGTFLVGARDGTLYSRVPDHQTSVGRQLEEFRELAEQTRKTHSQIVRSPLDGQQRLVTLGQTAQPELLFLSSLSMSTVQEAWYREARQTTAALLAALLLVGGLTYRLHGNHLQLLHLSTYDGLSGLLNRTTFTRQAGPELARLERYPGALSVIMLDIDNFKHINDHYGHAVGDKVIVEIARSLKAQTRECDLCARYGGEEFILLLPQTDLAGCRSLAEKLRVHLEQEVLLADQPQLKITGSFGIAQWQEGDSLDSLINRADQRMLQAKSAGKNRICSGA